jgi:hypothetical protein
MNYTDRKLCINAIWDEILSRPIGVCKSELDNPDKVYTDKWVHDDSIYHYAMVRTSFQIKIIIYVNNQSDYVMAHLLIDNDEIMLNARCPNNPSLTLNDKWSQISDPAFGEAVMVWIDNIVEIINNKITR